MFRSVLKVFSKKQCVPKPLGRWQVNTENCDTLRRAALTRMAMANMDSCGDKLCGTPESYKKLIIEDSQPNSKKY